MGDIRWTHRDGQGVSSVFDDSRVEFYALMNDEGQYSLWPIVVARPAGWAVAFGPDRREACLDYVERHWVDLRPRSLIEQMDAPSRGH